MTLMAGNIVEGTVINITNFGAFIEVEGKTGLVHISDLSWTKKILDIAMRLEGLPRQASTHACRSANYR